VTFETAAPLWVLLYFFFIIFIFISCSSFRSKFMEFNSQPFMDSEPFLRVSSSGYDFVLKTRHVYIYIYICNPLRLCAPLDVSALCLNGVEWGGHKYRGHHGSNFILGSLILHQPVRSTPQHLSTRKIELLVNNIKK